MAQKSRWIRLCLQSGATFHEDKTTVPDSEACPAVILFNGLCFQHRTFDGTWHILVETRMLDLEKAAVAAKEYKKVLEKIAKKVTAKEKFAARLDDGFMGEDGVP